jgi:hypothetical protein
MSSTTWPLGRRAQLRQAQYADREQQPTRRRIVEQQSESQVKPNGYELS